MIVRLEVHGQFPLGISGEHIGAEGLFPKLLSLDVAFAGACALASVYGFLQGAWPFGVIEAIFAGVAVW